MFVDIEYMPKESICRTRMKIEDFMKVKNRGRPGPRKAN